MQIIGAFESSVYHMQVVHWQRGEYPRALEQIFGLLA